MFEDLMQEITNVHGYTRYVPNCQGKAIKSYGSSYTRTRRSSSFTIYNNASYGARSSSAPPKHLGKSCKSIYIKRIGPPRDGSEVIKVPLDSWSHLVPERAVQSWMGTGYNQSRESVLQVSSGCLYLMFNIELVGDEEERTEILRDIYETYILSLDEAISSDMRIFMLEEDLIELSSRGIPVADKKEELPGYKKDWNFFKIKNFKEIPAESEGVKGALRVLMDQRKRGLKKRIEEEENEVRTNERYYENALRDLAKRREDFQTSEACFQVLKNTSLEELKEDDPTLLALSASVSAFYEKMWMKDDTIWALTKPIEMSYLKIPEQKENTFRALTGKFLVAVDKDGIVNYYREDGKVVLRSTDPHSNKIISPHSHVYSGENIPHICWGIYGNLIRNCQRDGDLGQLFLLVYRHLQSVTPNDCYMQLTEYATKLRLISTTDPKVNLFELEKKLEEKKLEEKKVELETVLVSSISNIVTVNTVQIPVERLRTPPPVATIEEGEDLSEEELLALGIGSESSFVQSVQEMAISS